MVASSVTQIAAGKISVRISPATGRSMLISHLVFGLKRTFRDSISIRGQSIADFKSTIAVE
jgi:hypothetical protein